MKDRQDEKIINLVYPVILSKRYQLRIIKTKRGQPLAEDRKVSCQGLPLSCITGKEVGRTVQEIIGLQKVPKTT